MRNLFLILFISAFSFTAMSNSEGEQPIIKSDSDSEKFQIPEDVQAIIDKSCYGCHYSDSKSKKGKMKLNFDHLTQLSNGKYITKLSKISKTVKNGKMPKKSFIEKYPDKALTTEEADRLTSWADKQVNSYTE